MPPTKLVFLMDGYSPYRMPLWEELAKDYELHVILLASAEKGRHWSPPTKKGQGFHIHILEARQIFVRRLDWALNLPTFSIFSLLRRISPQTLILGGWASPDYWAALLWARNNRRPCVLWMESNILSSRTQGNFIFNHIKRSFVRRCSAYYAFGDVGVQYLRNFGAPESRILNAINLPNISLYTKSEPDSIPSSPHSSSGICRILYAGQFIERKGVTLLPDIFSRITHNNWELTLVGSGPLRDMVASSLTSMFPEKIRFIEHVAEDRLAEIYRSTDILIFPSINEVWGMVVHEALLSGVYVVGSCRAASVLELIKPQENGSAIDPLDTRQTAEAIDDAISRFPFDRTRIRNSVAGYTFPSEVKKLRSALEIAHT